MAAATFPTTLQRLLLPALQQQPFPTLARPLSSQILANGFLRFGIPTLSIPSLSGLAGVLEGLWDSVLRAVPKKKTTHSKSRSRRLAGKALKDLINIGRCSACGRPKLSHTLCPHCVQSKCTTATRLGDSSNVRRRYQGYVGWAQSKLPRPSHQPPRSFPSPTKSSGWEERWRKADADKDNGADGDWQGRWLGTSST